MTLLPAKPDPDAMKLDYEKRKKLAGENTERLLRQANARLMDRERKANGMEPSGGVSPWLLKIIMTAG